jgi:guanylate kinase
MKNGHLFIISAPSGAGKTTIIQKLLLHDASLSLSISHTTRKPRKGECDGKDYYFINHAQFEALIKREAFAEYANVFGNFYGTAKKTLQDPIEKGIDTILDIDWQGAKNIKKKFPTSISIFITPPSLNILEERLRNRKTDDEETILKRLSQAREDVEHAIFYDYVVENDALSQAIDDVHKIINKHRKTS